MWMWMLAQNLLHLSTRPQGYEIDFFFCRRLAKVINPDVLHIHVRLSYLDFIRQTVQSCIPFIKDGFERLS